MNRRPLSYPLVLLLTGLCFWALLSCGRTKTERLLVGKTWKVSDVTPPAGAYNVELANRARELREGFYHNGWFMFLPDSVFIASLGGRTDTGRYHINRAGDAISLFPAAGGRMYEQIRIRHLDASRLDFTTVLADFHLVLHLTAAGGLPGK